MMENFRENFGIFYENYEKIMKFFFFLINYGHNWLEKTWILNLLVTLDPSLYSALHENNEDCFKQGEYIGGR